MLRAAKQEGRRQTLGDPDKPLETAERRARRMWGNHDLSRRFKETVKKNQRAAEAAKKEIEPADVISNDHRIVGDTARFERRLLKEMRDMLNEHTRRNLLMYKLNLRSQLHRLKAEKLKRLLAKQAAQKPKDLFS
jgi:hypothetical protein